MSQFNKHDGVAPGPSHPVPEVAFEMTDEIEKAQNDKTQPQSAETARRDPLKRTGRLFGGVLDDLRDRFTLSTWLSDYSDAIDFQLVTAVAFMFFANFAPAATFGGLMDAYTHGAMGIKETLIAQAACGVFWAAVSCQPLIVQSATGPFLIFETSLFAVCAGLGFDFLTVRLWASLWMFLLILVTVAFEGAFLLRYVTRYVEDVFSLLISVVFVSEALRFVYQTFKDNPAEDRAYYAHEEELCHQWHLNHSNESMKGYGELDVCGNHHLPDTALLTWMLLVSTFALATFFKWIRQSVVFGRTGRRLIGDFGMLISIVTATVVARLLFSHVHLKFVELNASFEPTSVAARGGVHWLVHPFFAADQSWGYAFAIAPGLFLFILVFVEIEVVELLLHQRDRGLRKGSGGHHWDMMLLALTCVFCGVCGLPWMSSEIVQSLAHADALTVRRRVKQDQPMQIVRVVEQRVSTSVINLLIGVCAFALPVILRSVPLAVLFGVFAYLGVMNMVGVQLVQRILLFAVPEKYFPDVAYCRTLGVRRLHMFTAIQCVCFITLYFVKHFRSTALAFPFVLALIAVFRQLVLPRIYTAQELEALDGHEKKNVDVDENDLYTKTTIAH